MYTIYLDLPLHGDAEEHDEVHYKYRPEHWHIEGIKKCANHGDDDAFRRRMPAKKDDMSSVDSDIKPGGISIQHILMLLPTDIYFMCHICLDAKGRK